MANKPKVISKAEAEKFIEERIKEEKEKERMREVIKRINGLMESAGLVRISKDGKRKFYQAGFQAAFGINKSTVSSYYKLEKNVPIETLLKIFNHEKINCSLDYLLLRSDAVNYEFDTVIKRTGLSEEAIEILANNNAIAANTEALPKEVSIYELYIEAVNYLITNGNAFIHSFARAKAATEHIRESEHQHIVPLDIPDQVIAHATMVYNDGHNTEASFTRIMEQSSFNMNDSEKMRPLTKEELHHLFEHVSAIRLYNPAIWRTDCRDQLESLLSAIKSSES